LIFSLLSLLSTPPHTLFNPSNHLNLLFALSILLDYSLPCLLIFNIANPTLNPSYLPSPYRLFDLFIALSDFDHYSLEVLSEGCRCIGNMLKILSILLLEY
jgi:hypothetical protein